MPLAVTHVLLAVILLDIFKHLVPKYKKYFTMKVLLVAAFFSLFPDIDIFISYILRLFGTYIPLLMHRGIMHTPFIGLLFLVPAFILRKKNRKFSIYFFVITFAILFHIFLDYLLGGELISGIMLFWPFSIQRYISYLFNFNDTKFLALDAIILIVWIFHEVRKRKLKDFF